MKWISSCLNTQGLESKLEPFSRHCQDVLLSKILYPILRDYINRIVLSLFSFLNFVKCCSQVGSHLNYKLIPQVYTAMSGQSVSGLSEGYQYCGYEFC